MDTVLVISDDGETTNQVDHFLGTTHGVVLFATDQQGVARHCVGSRPEVVIVDVGMRGGVGFEAISMVRRLNGDCLIIAVLQAPHNDVWLRVAEACGADDYVGGPLTVSSLYKALLAGKERKKRSKWLQQGCEAP